MVGYKRDGNDTKPFQTIGSRRRDHLTHIRANPADWSGPRLIRDDMVDRPLESTHDPRYGRFYLFGIQIPLVNDSLGQAVSRKHQQCRAEVLIGYLGQHFLNQLCLRSQIAGMLAP